MLGTRFEKHCPCFTCLFGYLVAIFTRAKCNEIKKTAIFIVDDETTESRSNRLPILMAHGRTRLVG